MDSLATVDQIEPESDQQWPTAIGKTWNAARRRYAGEARMQELERFIARACAIWNPRNTHSPNAPCTGLIVPQRLQLGHCQ